MAGGEAFVVVDGLVAAAFVLPLHGDLACRQVMVQVQGLAFLEGDRQYILGIGEVAVGRGQEAAHDQRGRHAVGGPAELAARKVPNPVGQVAADAIELDHRGVAAHPKACAVGGELGVEVGRRHRKFIVVRVAVVGQQGLGRHCDPRASNVGDDVVGSGHGRCVRLLRLAYPGLAVLHLDADGGGAFIAVCVTDGVDEDVGRTIAAHAVGVGVVAGAAVGIEDQVTIVAHDLGADIAVRGGGGVTTDAHANHGVAVGGLVRAQVIVVQHVAGDHAALVDDRFRIGNGLGHVIDDVDDDLAGDGVALFILRLVGEGLGRGVRAVVGTARGFRCRGQGVGISAVAVQMKLSVLPCGIAHQAVGQCTHATLYRAGQSAGGRFAGGGWIAAGDVARGQVLAILVQVQSFFIHRHVAVWAAHRQWVALHIEGDGGRAFVAIGITDGVDEGVCRTVADDAVGVGVVGRKAIGVDHQVAVVAHDLGADIAMGRGRGIVARPHADHDVAVGDLVRAQDIVVQHIATYHTARLYGG